MEDSNILTTLTNNELTVDKKTKLINIKNKEKYDKLIINTKTKTIFLNNFKNIKELVIDKSCYNEERIEKLSFKNNIEALTIKNINILGIKYDIHGFGNVKYKLSTYNLKLLELPDYISEINPSYIKDLSKLETIIFNISINTSSSEKMSLVLPSSLKNIIIKTKYNNYDINLEYKPKYLKKVYFCLGEIYLEFYNDYINTIVKIDNNKVDITNTLTSIDDNLVIDKCLYIPDYINNIKIKNNNTLKEIDSISINPKKIELNNKYDYRRLDEYLNNINKIIIRSDNEMKLKPNNVFTTDVYGKLKSIFIRNKKLFIVFSDILFIIDENGNIEKSKEFKEERNIDTNINSSINNSDEITEEVREDKHNNLNMYSARELEYYSYYKKLLELLSSEDKELNKAMNIVEKELIKKLKINE